MINELLLMNGYGLYVWSSVIFTVLCFISLYYIIKTHLVKEQNKFKIKYSHLTEEEIETVKKQETYREILDFNNISKI